MNIPYYIKQLDELMKEFDWIYRDAAVQYGMSDTAMWIIYNVSDDSESFTQQDLCRQCYFPKQTINTAINSLVKSGYALLEPITGTRNKKRIVLTESGKALAAETTDKLKKAELAAYSRFTDEELEQYREMTERINRFLREEAEKTFGKEIQK